MGKTSKPISILVDKAYVQESFKEYLDKLAAQGHTIEFAEFVDYDGQPYDVVLSPFAHTLIPVSVDFPPEKQVTEILKSTRAFKYPKKEKK